MRSALSLLALVSLLSRVPVAFAAGPAANGEPAPESAAHVPPADQVALKDALQRALDHSPTAAIAAAELRRAGAIVEEVRAPSLPTATLNGTYTHLDGTRQFAFNGNNVVVSPQDSLIANIQVAVPLVAPQQWVNWAHASNNEKAARWTDADARRQLLVAVAHAYLSVIAQKRVVDVNVRARENDKAHFDYTHQRKVGGLGTPLDELRARQQYVSDAAQVEAAWLGLERTQEALGVLLGTDHPVDTAEEPSFDLPREVAADPDLAVRDTPKLRADLLAGAEKSRAAKQITNDDWADYLPTLTGVFEPIYTAPPSFATPRWSWEILLTLTFSIYDGGLRYGLAKERAALLLEADKNLESSLRQAASDVRTGYRAIVRNDAALRDAMEAAAVAHQAFDVANLQYRAGATTNIDVIDAERRARDADTQAAISEDNARQARLDLLAAMGRFP